MNITPEQYKEISYCFPRQRGNVSLSNLSVLNAILFIMATDGKWRQLPAEFGNWHTIYVRMNRWCKNGTLEKVFKALQQLRLVKIKVEICSPHPEKSAYAPAPVQAAKERINFVWLPYLQQSTQAEDLRCSI